MKYGFWGFGLIMAGLVGVAFIVMFQSITVNNETEYYVLKEAMEASMLESVDIACYRDSNAEGCGEVIKISEQKFVENFTRRFVENITGDVNSYKLEFYDIIETPPKATVVVTGVTQSYSIMVTDGEDGSFDIKNTLNGILEYNPAVVDEKDPNLIKISNKGKDIDLNVNIGEDNNDTHKVEVECQDCGSEDGKIPELNGVGTNDTYKSNDEISTSKEVEPAPKPEPQEGESTEEQKEENSNSDNKQGDLETRNNIGTE